MEKYLKHIDYIYTEEVYKGCDSIVAYLKQFGFEKRDYNMDGEMPFILNKNKY